ncbi:hypothetical protein Tco_1377133 [Tanacetum coccineum]
MDWKTCVLTETFMYYQVFRGDRSSKNYKVLSEMLKDFDHRLVKEKYSASRLEGFDLMLWGDLYVLFESNEEDEIWKKKKYPLSQEMISKMLKKKLEVDHESSQAIELLRHAHTVLDVESVEFRGISLTKQTTRYPCEASHGHKIEN